MVISMAYYEQHGRSFHSHDSTRLSSLNRQNNPTSTVPINSCEFLLCRLTRCLFIFIIALSLFGLSMYNGRYGRDSSSIITFFLFAIATILCKRSCGSLKRYSLIINTRRQLTQRLHEQQQQQQQVYNSALSPKNDDNPELVTSGITDLPSYKELFPSHLDIRNNGNNPLPPPCYDSFVKRSVNHHPTATLSISSLSSPVLSILTTHLFSTSPSRSTWITDQTQRPIGIPGTITYL